MNLILLSARNIFYIASAEIITLDAFNKSQEKNDFVIGITIIKVGILYKGPVAFYSEL